MSVPVKLATFAILLVAIFAMAVWVGAAVGPIHLPTRSPHTPHGMSSPAPKRIASSIGPTVSLSSALVTSSSAPDAVFFHHDSEVGR